MTAARALGVKVIDRCNPTVLQEPGRKTWGISCRQHGSRSSPASRYLEDNVNRQRGRVFDRSIAALRSLNALGYGDPAGELPLNLVYNPQGPWRCRRRNPAWKATTAGSSGKITGPFQSVAGTGPTCLIQRFWQHPRSHGQFDDYVSLLKQAHPPRKPGSGDVPSRCYRSTGRGTSTTVTSTRCWARACGWLSAPRPHLRDLPRFVPAGNPIMVADHCYGCNGRTGVELRRALQNAG